MFCGGTWRSDGSVGRSLDNFHEQLVWHCSIATAVDRKTRLFLPLSLLMGWLLSCLKTSPILPLCGCQFPMSDLYLEEYNDGTFIAQSTYHSYQPNPRSYHRYRTFHKKEEEWKWTTEWDSDRQTSCATVSGLLLVTSCCNVTTLFDCHIVGGNCAHLPQLQATALTLQSICQVLQDKKTKQSRQMDDKDHDSEVVWWCVLSYIKVKFHWSLC